MFTRILVTVDSSMKSMAAIPYVRYLAFKFGTQLHLLGLSTESQQVWDKSLIAQVENISRNLQDENIITRANFVHGNPAVEVVKYIDKYNIDLVATSAGTGNFITCTILSRIAARMGINANIPILMVPPSRFKKEFDLSENIAFLKILVPMDCSQVGEAVIPYVETLAKKTGSSVTLLNVNTPPFRGVPVMHHEVIEISRWAGKEYVKRVCLRLKSQGIKSDFDVIDGAPVKTILKYAQQHKADLIALGTRRSSGIENWIFGNTANKVSDRTAVPVLTVSYPPLGPIGFPLHEYAERGQN
jgi:nucleotide-binding universal stress UspA family protein